MITRRFGKTDLHVPVIGLGTWKVFDVKGKEEEAKRHEVARVALEEGANLIDSSPMYGEAERVVAEAVWSNREQYIIATKVWSRHPSLSIDAQIVRALEFYQEHIDIYQIHNLHDWQDILEKLERLQATGNVGLIGATHYSPSAYPELMQLMRSGRIDAIQIPYNIEEQEVTKEVLPLAEELGLGVLVMQPLDTGRLSQYQIPETELKQFKEFGCDTWAQVLLKWIISDERVHCAIPATSKPHRMKENAQAGNGTLFDPSIRKEVEKIAREYRK